MGFFACNSSDTPRKWKRMSPSNYLTTTMIYPNLIDLFTFILSLSINYFYIFLWNFFGLLTISFCFNLIFPAIILLSDWQNVLPSSFAPSFSAQTLPFPWPFRLLFLRPSGPFPVRRVRSLPRMGRSDGQTEHGGGGRIRQRGAEEVQRGRQGQVRSLTRFFWQKTRTFTSNDWFN